MFGPMLALVILPGLLAAFVAWGASERYRPLLQGGLLGGYFLRLALTFILREVPFFSTGVGWDAKFYEAMAARIAAIWHHHGVFFVTKRELPRLREAALPPNIFAFINYINGSPSHLGCAALVAFCACATGLLLYHLSKDMGAPEKSASWISLVMLFSPGFLYYTSDTYKDAIVSALTLLALYSAMRVSRKFSLVYVALAGGSMFALWYVRYYLTFLAAVPLGVGFLGARSKSIWRTAAATTVALMAGLAVLSQTNLATGVADQLGSSFDQATNSSARAWNALGGSGVTFDDGGNPWGAMGPKLLYTLFSPFPWTSGSVGLQIGKLDVIIWYVVFVRAVLGVRVLWKRDPMGLLMLLSCIVPLTLAYATTMSNMGLILRQRLPIVILVCAISTFYKADEEPANEPPEGAEEADEAAHTEVVEPTHGLGQLSH